MNKLRKQSSTTYPLFFLMVDSTDHVTGKTGLSPTVTISKNGGSFASPSGAVSEVGNGLYKIAGNATDSNTVGELWIHATGTGADPTDTAYTVVPYDPFDSVRLGLTALPNAAAEAAGGLYTRGSGAGQINQPANGQIDANTVKVSGTSQTARDLGASVLLSSGTGTGQISLSSGAVLLQPTQTGVTIPTVTNLTNAPTSGDLTATMKASVTTAATAATPTIGGMSAAALASMFNVNSGTTYGAAVSGSVVKEIADNAGGSALTAGGIADAVWDEARSEHVALGSFGEGSASVQGNVVGSVGSVSAIVTANLTQIDGLATTGNNATLNLKKLNIVNDSGTAFVAESTGGDGHGIFAHGSTKDSAGILSKGGFSSGTAGTGIAAVSGSESLIDTGNGFLCVGSASGNGIYAAGPNGIVANGSNNDGRNDFVGDIAGNVTGSVGSLDNQAKTDVRTAVSTVLNTAIPPNPTVDSINERIVNIDEGGISGGSSAADVWSYPTRTLTPIGLGGSVVIPVATITSIITEAFKKAGINSPSTDLMTRAQVQWLEEIRTDLWKRVKKAKFLQARSVTLLVNGLAKYQNPSDFESDLTLEYATGSRYGTAQAGTLGTVTLATTENAQQADLIGKEIVLLSGSASGQISYIIGYDSTTKVATVSPSFTVAPSTDSYLIIDQYKPLEEKPLWEQQNLPNQTGQGTPDRFFPVGNATDGEFILWPVPYRTDSQPAIVLHRYYADISEIDTTGTLFATLLAKWRNLWLLGLKWKALDDADDDKEPAAQKAYLKELQEITRANYGNDLMNVQTKLGDY